MPEIKVLNSSDHSNLAGSIEKAPSKDFQNAVSPETRLQRSTSSKNSAAAGVKTLSAESGKSVASEPKPGISSEPSKSHTLESKPSGSLDTTTPNPKTSAQLRDSGDVQPTPAGMRELSSGPEFPVNPEPGRSSEPSKSHTLESKPSGSPDATAPSPKTSAHLPDLGDVQPTPAGMRELSSGPEFPVSPKPGTSSRPSLPPLPVLSSQEKLSMPSSLEFSKSMFLSKFFDAEKSFLSPVAPELQKEGQENEEADSKGPCTLRMVGTAVFSAFLVVLIVLAIIFMISGKDTNSEKAERRDFGAVNEKREEKETRGYGFKESEVFKNESLSTQEPDPLNIEAELTNKTEAR